MASDIEALTPKSMNLLNDNYMFELLSTNDYGLHEYNLYGNVDGSNPEINRIDMCHSEPNINALIASSTYFPMVSYSHHKKVENFDRRDNSTRDNYRSISPRGYDSDESCTSCSSKGTRDNNGLKSKYKVEESQNNSQLNNGVLRNNTHNSLQTNLYQPQYNHQHRNRYYSNQSISSHHNNNNNNNNSSNSSNRTKRINSRNSKVTDVMVRRAHGLMERFKSRVYAMKIDPNPLGLLNGGPWDQLNQAIWDVFCSKIQKEDTYLKKLSLWRSIFLYIRKSLSSYGLFLVGSTMSGFGLESSDIDMCLLTKPFIIHDPRIDSLHHLTHLKNLLLKGGIASDAELIMAKVPILKFKNKQSGFEVDLNCNNSVGIRNTHLLHCYARLDWRVRPLVVIVKLWAQANNINDAKNMTISSYSWALMVIHYLQCAVTPPLLPCLHKLVPDKFNSDSESMDVQEDIDLFRNYESNNVRCLGDLLIGFFQYYSNFNYAQYAISVRAGTRLPIDECRFLKTPKNDPNQWKCLCIEEPFDFSNTARSVFDPIIFRHIKNVITCSYKELARSKLLSYILPVNLGRQR